MRNLVYAFGIVALIDYTADGRMDMVGTMTNQTKQAFWNVAEGVIDGASYVIRRVSNEIDPNPPRYR